MIGLLLKKWMLIVLGVALSGTLLAEDTFMLSREEERWLEQHPDIRFAPAPYYPPVEFFDENDIYRGITADFLKIMSERQGLDMNVIQYTNWDKVVEAARNRDVDVWGAAAITPERQEYMSFTRPYIRLPAVIVVRKDLDGPLNMRDLDGHKVVLIKGYASSEYVKENYPNLDVLEVPDLETGLRMVSYGLSDAIIATNAAALFYIERDGLTNLRVAGESGFAWQLRFAVRNDWPELVTIIQKGLDSISDDELRTIFRRWINLGYEGQILTPQLLLQIAGGIFVLLAIMVFVWNRMLRHQVRERTQALKKELEERKALESKLRRLATTDELTGIMNRRHLFDCLRQELRRAERYDTSLALLMFDVDHFKQINDTYGHAAGDQVLKAVVGICQQVLRENDLFGRIGGEEFVVALLESDPATTMKVANRICQSIANTPIALSNGEYLTSTISIGVVHSSQDKNLEVLLSYSDRAMYSAKQKGRNRVEAFDSLESPPIVL
ncbi:transporter substrate-binding domain-containing diguanylate cyclase [Aliamphritea hakodatensis]|uniref:transporter substrate-binding domain-containing diguanylate cyclase n=1 Tax=Aliamphritea hakodatensis TaxID=2895352 RepID=UPI0022FD8B26|nr:diguanylate cyclase [Aliamphritea hakodatensis]